MNHPKDKSSKDFICQAFPEIKYYDMSSEYPSQRQVQAPQRRPLPGDSRNPNVLLPQKVRPEPAPTRTPLRRTHHEPRRRDERARAPRPPAMRYACLTPRSTRGPRSSTASARGRTRRRSHGQPSSRTAHAARMSTAAASTPLPSAPPSTSPTWIRSTATAPSRRATCAIHQQEVWNLPKGSRRRPGYGQKSARLEGA